MSSTIDSPEPDQVRRAWAPVTELKRFVSAALCEPVPRDHRQSDDAYRRRQIVSGITLVVGTLTFWWAMSIEAGDAVFYPATFTLAAVWVIGALASGPLHLGRAHTRSGRRFTRPVLQPFIVGLLLLGLFLAGAIVVAKIPLLREPVDQLLDHARYGSLPLIMVITTVNGITEEMYFRGALYAGIGVRYPVVFSAVLYMFVTAFAGIPLLVLAAALLGTVVGMQRRVTGGLLAPIITHLTWSLGMLLLLPPALDLFR